MIGWCNGWRGGTRDLEGKCRLLQKMHLEQAAWAAIDLLCIKFLLLEAAEEP